MTNSSSREEKGEGENIDAQGEIKREQPEAELAQGGATSHAPCDQKDDPGYTTFKDVKKICEQAVKAAEEAGKAAQEEKKDQVRKALEKVQLLDEELRKFSASELVHIRSTIKSVYIHLNGEGRQRIDQPKKCQPKKCFGLGRSLPPEEKKGGDKDSHLEHINRQLKAELDLRLASLNPTVDKMQGITFKWGTAHILARLCNLVYQEDCKSEEKRRMACKKWIADEKPLTDYVTSDNGTNPSNVALVVASKSSIYLVFRGTVSKTNWCQNFTMCKSKFEISGEDDPVGKVHGGFYKAQESLWKKLTKENSLLAKELHLGEKSWPKKDFYIGGHSLGGAMGVITAARLAIEKAVKRVDGVYTFGSPAMFDSDATKRYNSHPVLAGRTFRVKYKGDMFLISQAWRLLHPGTSIRLTKRDGETVQARIGLRNNFLRFCSSRGKPHKMKETYLEKIFIMYCQHDTSNFPQQWETSTSSTEEKSTEEMEALEARMNETKKATERDEPEEAIMEELEEAEKKRRREKMIFGWTFEEDEDDSREEEEALARGYRHDTSNFPQQWETSASSTEEKSTEAMEALQAQINEMKKAIIMKGREEAEEGDEDDSGEGGMISARIHGHDISILPQQCTESASSWEEKSSEELLRTTEEWKKELRTQTERCDKIEEAIMNHEEAEKKRRAERLRTSSSEIRNNCADDSGKKSKGTSRKEQNKGGAGRLAAAAVHQQSAAAAASATVVPSAGRSSLKRFPEVLELVSGEGTFLW